MAALRMVMTIVLVVVTGFLLMSGLFSDDKGLFKAIETTGDTLSEAAEEYTGTDIEDASVVSTTVSDQEAFDALVSKLSEIRDETKKSGETNCFAKFSGFPLLETGGSSISLESRSYATSGSGYEESTKLRLYGGKNGQQLVESVVVDGIKPCLIYGASEVNNFQDIFYDAEVTFEDGKIVLPDGESYYTDAFSYTIYGDGELNWLSYGGKLSFQDVWIFTPDGKSMCIFPYFVDTFPLECRSAAEPMLSDRCFDSDVEGSIYDKIGKNGVARYCTGVGS